MCVFAATSASVSQRCHATFVVFDNKPNIININYNFSSPSSSSSSSSSSDLYMMRDEDDGFSSFSDEVQKTSFKQLSSDVHVDGRKRIIHEIYVPVTVHCPGYTYALLLTSAQVDTSLTDLPQPCTSQHHHQHHHLLILPCCMECRRVLAMRILFVRPSVCETRDLSQNKNKLCPHSYTCLLYTSDAADE